MPATPFFVVTARREGFRDPGPPCPDIAVPERGQHVSPGRVRPPIAQADLDQDVG